MAFSPIVYPPQFYVAGEPASGYYLKAYKANTTTAIQLATDRTGGTLVNKIQLNSEGYPEVSNNIIIPHVNQENKLALYPTETAADTDDTDSVIWIPDKIDVGSLPASYVDSIDTLSDLRNYSGESRTILLEGSSSSGDGDGALYYYSSGQSAGTYTDNGNTIIVPTGGDGSAAYLLIQMSHPDDLEYPVSTTTSGGTAGINYDVADWPDTLVSGRTYYARAHTSSQGSYSIDPGGGEITVLEPGGDASKPLDWPENTVMGFRYDGTNLIQTFIPKPPILRTSASASTDAWTRLARVTLTAQNAFCMLELRLNNISRRYAMDSIVEIFQSATLGSDPSTFALTKMVTGESNTIFMHDKVALHYSTVSGTESVVDVYWTGGGSSLSQSDLDPRRITIQDSANVQVQFYESQGTDTEANITGGTFDVTSQAARGEVVTGSFTTASLAQNSSENNVVTHNLGTDSVLVTGLGISGSSSNDVEMSWLRPDGMMGRFFGTTYDQTPANISFGTISNGTVEFQTFNRNASSQTVTVYYQITAQ